MNANVDEGFLAFVQNFLRDKFGDGVVAVYGIGSSFMSELKASDRDVVVVLSSTDKCPRKDWTTALFEHHSWYGSEVWFLYGTLDDYLDKDRFRVTSFANWEWAVRGIKHASVLLFGSDIRDQLPSPDYDYQDILVRVAYHLEPTPKWKSKKAIDRGDPIDDKMRFTKAVFKFGFFLTAIDYPDENVFDKEGVRELLDKSCKDGIIGHDVLDFYDIASDYRKGIDIPEFERRRQDFMKTVVRETISATENTWEGARGIRSIFQDGFKYPFSGIIKYIDNNGWKY